METSWGRFCCVPDEELDEGGRTLVYHHPQRLQVKLEEDARCAVVMRQDPSIVRNAVLVRLNGFDPRCFVSCGDNAEEILVGDESWWR